MKAQFENMMVRLVGPPPPVGYFCATIIVLQTGLIYFLINLSIYLIRIPLAFNEVPLSGLTKFVLYWVMGNGAPYALAVVLAMHVACFFLLFLSTDIARARSRFITIFVLNTLGILLYGNVVTFTVLLPLLFPVGGRPFFTEIGRAVLV